MEHYTAWHIHDTNKCHPRLSCVPFDVEKLDSNVTGLLYSFLITVIIAT